MTLTALYQLADDRNIEMDYFLLSRAESLSAELADGRCVIAIDPTKIRSEADEKVKAAHEIGHCERGAFYNPYSSWDVRQRHEHKANRWAFMHLCPYDEMLSAMKGGCVTAWDLAERFGVTQEFIEKAYAYYTGPCGLTF